MAMYVDVVQCTLDGVPLFHGEPDQVKTWLLENEGAPSLECAEVYDRSSEKRMSVEKYLERSL